MVDEDVRPEDVPVALLLAIVGADHLDGSAVFLRYGIVTIVASLVRRLGLKPAQRDLLERAVSMRLDELERAGFVRCTPYSRNEEVTDVWLTELGQSLVGAQGTDVVVALLLDGDGKQ